MSHAASMPIDDADVFQVIFTIEMTHAEPRKVGRTFDREFWECVAVK